MSPLCTSYQVNKQSQTHPIPKENYNNWGQTKHIRSSLECSFCKMLSASMRCACVSWKEEIGKRRIHEGWKKCSRGRGGGGTNRRGQKQTEKETNKRMRLKGKAAPIVKAPTRMCPASMNIQSVFIAHFECSFLLVTF